MPHPTTNTNELMDLSSLVDALRCHGSLLAAEQRSGSATIFLHRLGGVLSWRWIRHVFGLVDPVEALVKSILHLGAQ